MGRLDRPTEELQACTSRAVSWALVDCSGQECEGGVAEGHVAAWLVRPGEGMLMTGTQAAWQVQEGGEEAASLTIAGAAS